MLGTGLLAHLPELLSRYCPAPHYAIITDATVGPLYAEPAAQALGGTARVTVAGFPAGEAHKTRRTWADLTDRLLAAELGRDGAIVALGGGVVGDLAGFVAATYLRGIPYVQVPTTVLAMIDSSIGGKTGVDTPAGKNLVGAFHQPRAVLADIATLATLPRNHRLAGMAEAVKHGAVADPEYFDRLRVLAPAIVPGTGDPDALREVVERSTAIKAAIVAEDEREHGRRAVLNFGHTFAHAIETGMGYGKWLHGEAVAAGMVRAAEWSARPGLIDEDDVQRVRTLIARAGLPVAGPAGLPPERYLELMAVDKKVAHGRVRFVLLDGVGQAVLRGDPGALMVRQAITATAAAATH